MIWPQRRESISKYWVFKIELRMWFKTIWKWLRLVKWNSQEEPLVEGKRRNLKLKIEIKQKQQGNRAKKTFWIRPKLLFLPPKLLGCILGFRHQRPRLKPQTRRRSREPFSQSHSPETSEGQNQAKNQNCFGNETRLSGQLFGSGKPIFKPNEDQIRVASENNADYHKGSRWAPELRNFKRIFRVNWVNVRLVTTSTWKHFWKCQGMHFGWIGFLRKLDSNKSWNWMGLSCLCKEHQPRPDSPKIVEISS